MEIFPVKGLLTISQYSLCDGLALMIIWPQNKATDIIAE